MLKLIAPFRVFFKLDGALITAHPAKFRQFLAFAQDKLADPQSSIGRKLHPSLNVKVNIPSDPEAEEASSRYVSMDKSGSHYLVPSIFVLRFIPSETNEMEKIFSKALAEADARVAEYSAYFSPNIDSAQIDLHDNTIAILSLELALNSIHDYGDENAWDRLDEWTTFFVHYLLHGLYQSYIFPLLFGLSKLAKEYGQPFIQGISQYKTFLDFVRDAENPMYDLDKRFKLLWVNRTLCYNKSYPENNWTRQLVHQHNEAIKIADADVHLNAGNSIVFLFKETDKEHLSQLWDVTLAAQYYYAALDIVNVQLVKYMTIAFNKQTSKELHHLNNEMEDVINLVTLLQMHYNDTAVELQGTSRKIFHLLQKEWGFDNLVRNVQRKLDLCKSNITILKQENGERNQGRMEIVLTGLAGISVLNIFVELGSYATQLPPGNKYMVGNIPGFMDLGFLLSGNELSWIGIFIAIAVIIFAVRHQR